MPNYQVELTPVAGHSIPPLLRKFGTWLSSQKFGGVGTFSLHTEAVSIAWNPKRIP